MTEDGLSFDATKSEVTIFISLVAAGLGLSAMRADVGAMVCLLSSLALLSMRMAGVA